MILVILMIIIIIVIIIIMITIIIIMIIVIIIFMISSIGLFILVLVVLGAAPGGLQQGVPRHEQRLDLGSFASQALMFFCAFVCGSFAEICGDYNCPQKNYQKVLRRFAETTNPHKTAQNDK